ncbi:hypothetical protein [Tannerella sp.]|uniref:hypothetical protein n=1 Tax=Tannerella sp. TaxID=2382127 RepID=UPI0026DB7109|nr:hypothetical protein [Tannerella sp.]MDO4703757.1 hypothetical protein [Tannerella sp.]
MNKVTLVSFLLIFVGGSMTAQTHRAVLSPVDADGFYAIDLPAPLIGAARADLADLRICDEHGREVAYFVREATSVSRGHDFEPYPIELSRRTSQTDIRIQTDGERVSSFTVRVKHADTDKRATLKGSNDGENWYAVRDHIRLSEQAEVRGTEAWLTVSFPVSDYRYYLLSVNDSLSAPLNILSVGRNGVGDIRIRHLMNVPATHYALRTDNVRKQTEVTLAFPYAYRFEDVVFYISAPEDYDRAVWLDDVKIGRLRSEAGSSLALRSLSYGMDTLRFRIANGDDQPLRIDSVSARIVRRYAVAQLKKGRYTLTYGNAGVSVPQYDLTFRKRVPDELPHLSVVSMERTGAPDEPPHPWMVFLKTYGVWIVIVLVTIQLLYMVWRMMRKGEG